MRVRKWFDNNEYWLRWVRWFVFPLLGVLAAIWIAAADAYKKVDTIPQLVEQVAKLSRNVHGLGADLREDLRKAEYRQGFELTAHTQDERSARDALGSSLKAVQAELISIKTKVDGKIDATDVRRLISKVEEVTATEAAAFAGISIEGKPQISSKFLAAHKNKSPEHVYAMKADNLAQSLAVLMFAKGGFWEPTQTGLKVKFEGGEAMFAAKANASKYELTRKADLFNSLSHSAGGVGGPWIVPERGKNPGVTKLPGSQITPVPAPLQRAPSFSDKLKN